MKVTFRVHAVRRMFERGITTLDVAEVLARGEEVASYPLDAPYPSRLLLGWRSSGPLHVVVAYNASEGEDIVITVYEADPAIWDDTFKRKRP